MKRIQKKHHGVMKFWNLIFWEKCKECKMEFRQMTGWETRMNELFIGIVPSRMSGKVCFDCAPTPEDAAKILTNDRLTIPPLSPPRKP